MGLTSWRTHNIELVRNDTSLCKISLNQIHSSSGKQYSTSSKRHGEGIRCSNESNSRRRNSATRSSILSSPIKQILSTPWPRSFLLFDQLVPPRLCFLQQQSLPVTNLQPVPQPGRRHRLSRVLQNSALPSHPRDKCNHSWILLHRVFH